MEELCLTINYIFNIVNTYTTGCPLSKPCAYVNIFSVSLEILASLMEPKGSLPYIQESITDPHLSQMNPVRSLYTIYLRPISVLFYRIWRGLPSRLFHLDFLIKIVFTFLISHMCFTSTALLAARNFKVSNVRIVGNKENMRKEKSLCLILNAIQAFAWRYCE